MLLANLIVATRPRVGLACEEGYALLPEGMPACVQEVAEGGQEMLRVLGELRPCWLEVIPEKKAHYAPALQKGRTLFACHPAEEAVAAPVEIKPGCTFGAAGMPVHLPGCAAGACRGALLAIVGRALPAGTRPEGTAVFGIAPGLVFSLPGTAGAYGAGFVPLGPCVTRGLPDRARLHVCVDGLDRAVQEWQDLPDAMMQAMGEIVALAPLETGDGVLLTGAAVPVAPGQTVTATVTDAGEALPPLWVPVV